MAAHQSDSSDNEHHNHSQDDSILRDVLTLLVAPQTLREIFHFAYLLISRSIGRRKRNLLRLFALPLPGVDAFEKLLDNALEFCVILLSGRQVAQFVDTLLDLDGHSMRLMSTP